MATGEFLTWAVQAQSAPAHVGRLLQSVLLNEGVVDVAGDSFKVAQNTGSDMNVKIGSTTVGDLAVVDGDDVAGQGVYVLEAQNGTVTRAVAASDPSNPRIDLVVLQNYDNEADSSGLNDADVEVIQGTPAGSPSAPALPASAISLATIAVAAGVTAITNANITDTRAEARIRGQHVQTVRFTASGTFTKADYPWLKKVRVQVQAGGGAGGGATVTTAGQVSTGGGGGAGGYASTEVLVGALSASETVTVGAAGAGVSGADGGAGGTTSFGAHASATGGGGGVTALLTAGVSFGAAGAGGGGTAGDLQVAGGDGTYGTGSVSQDRINGGTGGSSRLGGGGRGCLASQTTGTGDVGGVYGGGGGGAGNRASQAAVAGAAGAAGIVIVDLYA